MPKPTTRQLNLPTLSFKLPDDYDENSHPQIKFNPKKIVHVMISITHGCSGLPEDCEEDEEQEDEDGKEARFVVSDLQFETKQIVHCIPEGENPYDFVRSFVEGLEAAFPLVCSPPLSEERYWKGITPTKNPYDIPLPAPHQGFVVLQLNPKTNWRFMRGDHGITTKDFYSDDNFRVRYLDSDSNDVDENGRTSPQHSRILYFAYARRTKSTPQAFNFCIEFLWDIDGVEYGIPTIFDPNIPDQGGGSIP